MAAENQVSDLNAEMDDLLGLPLDTELELAEVSAPPGERLTREQYLSAALDRNPELQAAKETVSKARSALDGGPLRVHSRMSAPSPARRIRAAFPSWLTTSARSVCR